MLNQTRAYLRRAIFRMYRYLKHPRRLKASPVMRWFAQHFLGNHVWRPCQATFAGGAAVGFFVSAQLIPGQIPLAIALAALFRVNIPVAIVVSWISNPFTFPPIGILEHQFGRWMLDLFGNPTVEVLHEAQSNGELARGIRFAQAMYLGGFVGGLLGAPIAFAVSWLSWTGIARLLHIPLNRPIRRKRLPAPKTPPPSAEPETK